MTLNGSKTNGDKKKLSFEQHKFKKNILRPGDGG